MNNNIKIPGQEINGALYVGIMVDKDDNPYELYVEKHDYSEKELNWYEAVKIKEVPSIKEMNLISANSKALGLENNNYYWSTTDYNNIFAWSEQISNGNQTIFNKNSTVLVRCVKRVYITRPFNNLDTKLPNSKQRVKSELKKQTILLEKILGKLK